MNANNCGKGLAVFSVTLVLGFASASLFIPNAEITEIPQPQITKKEVSVKPKETKICVHEYQKLDKYAEEDYSKFVLLLKKEQELALKLAEKPAEKDKKALENVERELRILKKSPAKKRYGYESGVENQQLLYTENCYENKF
jgi:predicted ribonuclease YlaK